MSRSEKFNKFSGTKIQDNQVVPVDDYLAVEAALQITINSIPYTVTMRTPGDDRVLVGGLLYTEGILAGPEDMKNFHEEENPETGITETVNVWLSFSGRDKKQLSNNRTMVSSASCGLCGKTELSAIAIEGEGLTPAGLLDTGNIESMYDKMKQRQKTFQYSGGSHAAAAFDNAGKLLAIFEDIGRHNAVDKVIGGLLETGDIPKAEFMLVSGRISYEIVSKTYRAGIPFLLAVSAPSTLAVQLAERLGMTLFGFCRGNRATVYSNPQNVLQTRKIADLEAASPNSPF
ncbi:MAG: formate dehydrogenase accessory sulfurtransferase FdhD [SAR324 cluster bacterium]|nr:formate dehydrogenase accessory sulfurtransferase FdhD [SAR324 cluster bacterium]